MTHWIEGKVVALKCKGDTSFTVIHIGFAHASFAFFHKLKSNANSDLLTVSHLTVPFHTTHKQRIDAIIRIS